MLCDENTFTFSQLSEIHKLALYWSARCCYPQECCGFIIYDTTLQDYFHINVHNTEKDEMTFSMDEKEMENVLYSLINHQICQLVGVYHSHTHYDQLEMSYYDKAMLLAPVNIGITSKLQHIILGIKTQQNIEQVKTYTYQKQTHDFICKETYTLLK